MDKINSIRRDEMVLRDGALNRKSTGGSDITLFAAIAIASIISLGEISLTFASLKSVTLLVSLLYILTTLVYRSRYSVNLEKGRACPVYVNAYNEYLRLRDELSARGLISRVSEYCLYYTGKELAQYREGLLAEVGISYAEYNEKYRNVRPYDLRRRFKLPAHVIRAIIRCQNVKAVKLNKNMILLNDGDSRGRSKPFGISSKHRQRIDNRVNMVSRICMTILSGAVAVSFIIDPTLETLVLWCVRMLPVVSAAFWGANHGYRNGSETASAYLNAQIIRIKEIFEWAEENDYSRSEEKIKEMV